MSQGTLMLKDRGRDGGLSMLFIGFFVFGLLSTVIGVTIPNVKEEFDISNEDAAMVFVCWSAGVLIGAYVGGKAFYFAKARTLLIATSLSSIACLLLLYSEKDLLLYRIYIFALSLSGSMFFTAGHATAANAGKGNKVSILSFMDFLFSMGSLSTPLLVNYLTSASAWTSSNWRSVFLVAAALLAALLVLSIRSPESPSLDSARNTASVKAGYLSVLANPIFLIFMLACLFLQATEWGHCVWFVTYAHEAVGLSTEHAREAFSLFLVGMASSRLLISWLTWIFRSTTLMAILISIATVAATSIEDHQNYYSLCILNFMFGFGLGALFPLMLGLSMELAPARSSMLSGIGLMAGTMGAKGLSYLIGLFADWSSLAESYQYVSWAIAALLLGVLAFLSLHIQLQGSKNKPAVSGGSPRDAPKDGPGEGAHQVLPDPGRPPETRVAFSFNPLRAASRRGLDSRFSLHGSLRRALLDMELRREFEALFGKRHRLTREEALSFLNHAWDKYPLMREFYPSAAEILAVADRNLVLAAADQNPAHR